jgi:hypothetical protein
MLSKVARANSKMKHCPVGDRALAMTPRRWKDDQKANVACVMTLQSLTGGAPVFPRGTRQSHESPGADRSNAHARGLRSSKQPVATRVARYTLGYLPGCRHHRIELTDDGMILVSNRQVAVAMVERNYSGRYQRRGDAIRATRAVRTPF